MPLRGLQGLRLRKMYPVAWGSAVDEGGDSITVAIWMWQNRRVRAENGRTEHESWRELILLDKM